MTYPSTRRGRHPNNPACRVPLRGVRRLRTRGSIPRRRCSVKRGADPGAWAVACLLTGPPLSTLAKCTTTEMFCQIDDASGCRDHRRQKTRGGVPPPGDVSEPKLSAYRRLSPGQTGCRVCLQRVRLLRNDRKYTEAEPLRQIRYASHRAMSKSIGYNP
jgi:hypothetical protein